MLPDSSRVKPPDRSLVSARRMEFGAYGIRAVGTPLPGCPGHMAQHRGHLGRGVPTRGPGVWNWRILCRERPPCRSAVLPETIAILRRIRMIPQFCHPERAKRVEGSSHLRSCRGRIGAKILRLRASPFAQDDKPLSWSF